MARGSFAPNVSDSVLGTGAFSNRRLGELAGAGNTSAGQLLDINRQLERMRYQTQLGGQLSGFVGNQRLQTAAMNQTELVTDILRQLEGGRAPEELGLTPLSEFQGRRQALESARQDLLLGPKQFDSPLSRLSTGIRGLMTARGFFGGRGTSEESLQSGSTPEQLAMLRAGIFGGGPQGEFADISGMELPEAGGLALLKAAGQVSDQNVGQLARESRQFGRVNQFNPPPFFNLL